jgi:hypothetical protein
MRKFFWGARCDEAGHLNNFGRVAHGETRRPPIEGVPDACAYCLGTIDLFRLAAYDAHSKEPVSEEFLWRYWQDLRLRPPESRSKEIGAAGA